MDLFYTTNYNPNQSQVDKWMHLRMKIDIIWNKKDILEHKKDLISVRICQEGNKGNVYF